MTSDVVTIHSKVTTRNSVKNFSVIVFDSNLHTLTVYNLVVN